jgi:tetratricopeptide (TPR) repeat protein
MKWSGYFRRHDGRRVGAIMRFRERVVSDTYDQFQLGRDHLRSGRPAQATVSLEKAKRAEPTSRSIREALGIAYFRLGRWREAEAEFRVLVELDPSDEFAHYALGRALVNQGRRKEALPHVKLGRALRPRVPPDGESLE